MMSKKIRTPVVCFVGEEIGKVFEHLAEKYNVPMNRVAEAMPTRHANTSNKAWCKN